MTQKPVSKAKSEPISDTTKTVIKVLTSAAFIRGAVGVLTKMFRSNTRKLVIAVPTAIGRGNAIKSKHVKLGFIYIITNKYKSTYCIGVTSNLPNRILEHIKKRYKNSFSTRYHLNKLAYYKQFQMIGDAIAKEKQLKAGSRASKVTLIHNLNPHWLDLCCKKKI
jgi:putative endonuclease